MKVYIGYSGSDIFGERARARGHKTVSCDANPKLKCDRLKDMLTEDPIWIAENFDLVQLSPMCTSFSLSTSKHWAKDRTPKTVTAIVGRDHLLHCLKILNECSKRGKICFIENPNGRSIWFMPDELRQQVTYCQYGHPNMKLTNIWTNSNWKGRPKCKNGDSCHVPAPRGSQTGTQGQKGNYERSILPIELCDEWIKYAESTLQR